MILSQALALVGVITACVTDTTARRVPNWLTVPLMLLGLALGAVQAGLPGFLDALWGLLAAIAVFLLPFAMRWMGGGDVKLLAALGALLGLKSFVWVALYSAIAGGALSLVLVVCRQLQAKEFWRQLKLLLWSAFGWAANVPGQRSAGLPILPKTREALREKHPYAIAIALGTVIALLQGQA